MSSENRNTSGIGNGYRTIVKIPERKKKLDRHRHKRYQNWSLKKNANLWTGRKWLRIASIVDLQKGDFLD
jgi:hypothetical protein